MSEFCDYWFVYLFAIRTVAAYSVKLSRNIKRRKRFQLKLCSFLYKHRWMLLIFLLQLGDGVEKKVLQKTLQARKKVQKAWGLRRNIFSLISFTQSVWWTKNCILCFGLMWRGFDKCRINFRSRSNPRNRSGLARRRHLTHPVGVSELLLQLLLFALILHRQVKLELGRKFFFRVQTIGKVDSSNTAIGVDLKTIIWISEMFAEVRLGWNEVFRAFTFYMRNSPHSSKKDILWKTTKNFVISQTSL